MALLEWRDDFSIGIPSIDYEHKGMIRLINQLHDSLSAGASRDAVADFLGEIHSLISAHFALEEKEMLEMGYTSFKAHKADHERLLDEIRDIMDAFETQEADDYFDALGRRLDTWFSEHFRTQDAELHRYLKSLANR
ncbi:MAG: hemerythrin family protein [Rhodospirillales bacterium]|nr:MAG: hemerythrin family protein [Rhodospirillales bacterium]